MLFRIDFNAYKQSQQGNLVQRNVSQLAGACWRKLPESRKQIYRDLAKKERDVHMAKHPSYTYKYNDELNMLRKPASAARQLHHSMNPKAEATGLTDGTLPLALLPGRDWLFPNWDFGESGEDIHAIGEGTGASELEGFDNFDFNWHDANRLHSVY